MQLNTKLNDRILLLITGITLVFIGINGQILNSTPSISTNLSAPDQSYADTPIEQKINEITVTQTSTDSATIKISATFEIKSITIQYGTDLESLDTLKTQTDSDQIQLNDLEASTQYFFITKLSDGQDQLFESGVSTFNTN